MKRIIIDTDMGADDAVAVMMALQHPDVQVEAITTVAGNVPVEQATRNALYVVELCRSTVPVYQGVGQPLSREAGDAQDIHGVDGLGDLGLKPPQTCPKAEHAVEALISHLLKAPGEITLVTLGPLTNIALSLLREPALAFALRDVVVMGGAVNALGNVTPSAEFNIWADPEAANTLLRSRVPVTLVGWQLVWGDMLLTADEMAYLRSTGSRCAEFALDCNRVVLAVYRELLGEPVLALGDAIAMAVAIDSSICRKEFLYVAVETGSNLTRGETVVDSWRVLGQPPNAYVCFGPDAAKFKRLLFDTLTGPSASRDG